MARKPKQLQEILDQQKQQQPPEKHCEDCSLWKSRKELTNGRENNDHNGSCTHRRNTHRNRETCKHFE